MSSENDSTKGPLTQFESAKGYMDNNKIPEMFQSLMASLMLERPENHYDFLDTKLEAIKEMGLENVDWETFVYDLHPTRDELRQELIQDGKVYEKKPDTSAEGQSKPIEDGDTDMPDEDYEPQLFQLTETKD